MTVVLLASGGLDSAVLAAMNPGAVHLSVDYGQRHRREIAAAAAVADYYAAEHVITAADLTQLAPSVLTGEVGPMSGAPTVVPGRNGILLALGVALGWSRGGGQVLIGCNADDHATYPDCRPAFIEAAAAAARVATDDAVDVAAPLLHLTKPDIGELARGRAVPIHLTWSCYVGGRTACGTCGACEQRERALHVHDH